jgi:hypothetical protein
MIEKISVVAKEGCTCPMENVREGRISDSVPQSVPRSPYYTRLLRDGSLRLWQEPKPATTKKIKETEKPEKNGGDK